MKKLLSWITGAPVEQIGEYFKEKQRLKHELRVEELRGKVEWEKAKTRRASESEGRDHEWELMSIQNSGWKDEWVLVVLSIPMILSFIPHTVAYVQMGFAALENTPVWYRITVASIYLATFGLRLWRRDVSIGTNLVDKI